MAAVINWVINGTGVMRYLIASPDSLGDLLCTLAFGVFFSGPGLSRRDPK